jgi:hypothetical protein
MQNGDLTWHNYIILTFYWSNVYSLGRKEISFWCSSKPKFKFNDLKVNFCIKIQFKICSLILSSWVIIFISTKISSGQFNLIFLKSYSQSFLDFKITDIVTENYVSNTVWDLLEVKNYTLAPKDRFQYYYSDYVINQTVVELTLRRKPLYFMINSIFPCKAIKICDKIVQIILRYTI